MVVVGLAYHKSVVVKVKNVVVAVVVVVMGDQKDVEHTTLRSEENGAKSKNMQKGHHRECPRMTEMWWF